MPNLILVPAAMLLLIAFVLTGAHRLDRYEDNLPDMGEEGGEAKSSTDRYES